jgi:hypothetical protein
MTTLAELGFDSTGIAPAASLSNDSAYSADASSLFKQFSVWNQTDIEAARRDAVREAEDFKPLDTVNYSDPADPQAVRVGKRTRDLYQLDIDPFGSATARYGERLGVPADVNSDTVVGLNVFGKMMSADYLRKTEAGRRLLDLSEKNRKGMKRGFLGAITDIQIGDIPFFSLFATVGRSISDAVTVSDTMKKLQHGEKVSDDELIKTRLYMAEQEYNGNGTFGAMVGDIVRAAPGFMFEFAISGGVLSALRAGATKLVGKSASALTTLAVNRATKTLGRELAEAEITRLAAVKTGEGVAARVGVKALDSVAVSGAEKAVATTLRPYVMQSMKGFDDDIVDKVVENLAKKRVAQAVSKLGASNGFKSFMIAAGQNIKDYAARGLIDFGHWGTKESTVLFAKHNKAGQALADALGAFVVEAPLRGTVMYGTGKLVQQPLQAMFGQDGRTVSRTQLSLQASALRQGNKELMADAESISMGMDMLEYISENAGRGFGALARSVGLATGVSKPVGRALVGEAGGVLREAEGLQAGGYIRNLVRKYVGTPEEFAAKNREVRTDAVMAKLSKALPDHELDRASIAQMIASGSSDAVSDRAVKNVVGRNVEAFVKAAVSESFEKEKGAFLNKAYLRFTLADMMARHNWGPDTVMNAFERMGYDGVLGEMFEERYIDFAKGLFGLDDKADHGWKENVAEAFKNLYPGWDQLCAEAIGFSIPGLVRSAALNIQRRIGDSNQVEAIRRTGRNYQTALTGQYVVEASLGEYLDRVEANIDTLNERRRKVLDDRTKEIDALQHEGVAVGSDEFVKRTAVYDSQYTSLTKRIEMQIEAKRRTLEANNITDIAKANLDRIMRFAVTDTSVERGNVEQDKLAITRSDAQLTEVEAAKNAFLADVPMIGEAMYDAVGDGDAAELPFHKKLMGKLAGFAAALVCGDPALAFRNYAEWASVDEGLDPVIASGLKNIFSMKRTEARDRLIKKAGESGASLVTEAEIRAEMRESYEQAARKFAETRMAIAGVRMFSRTEMLDQAVVYLARQNGYTYGKRDRVFTKTNPDGSTESLSFDDFYKANKAAADRMRNNIGVQTLRLLSDESVTNTASSGMFSAVVELPADAPEADKIATALALQMSGFGNVLRTVNLTAHTSLESIAAEGNVLLPGDVVARVAQTAVSPDGTVNYDAVSADDVAAIASQLNYPVRTGSEKELTQLRRTIVDVCRQIDGAVDVKNTRAFVRDIENVDERLYPEATQQIVATRRSDGRWYVTFDSAPESGASGQTVTTSFATEDELNAFMKGETGELKMPFRPVERGVVMAQASIIRSEDPFLLAQKLGLAKAYLDRTVREKDGVKDYSKVHPALRRKADGSWGFRTQKEIADKVDAERRLALRYRDFHDDISLYRGSDESRRVDDYRKCKAAWEAVYGERGYMRVLNDMLADAGVTVPSADDLANLATGRPAQYQMALRAYTARTQSAKTYIPIDFLAANDYTAAVLNASLTDAFGRYRHLVKSGATFNRVLKDFVKVVDQIAERMIYSVDTTKEVREELTKMRRDITSTHQHPSVRAFSELASAFALFQTERDRASGHKSSSHAAAYAAIAEEVRNTPQFLSFMGLVDLMLGGDGFAYMNAAAETGAKVDAAPPTGIARMMALFGGNDLESFTEALSKFRPCGLTIDEFVDRVNRAAHDIGLDVPKPTDIGVPGKVSDILGRIRDAFTKNKITDMAEVNRIFSSIARIKGFKIADTIRERVAELDSVHNGFVSEIARKTQELQAAKAEIARASKDANFQAAELRKMRDKKEALENSLRDSNAANAKLERELADVKAQLATMKGGEAGQSPRSTEAPTPPTGVLSPEPPRAVPRRTRNRGGDPDARLSITFNDFEDTLVPTFLEYDVDGNPFVSESREVASNFTEKAAEYGANIVFHYINVVGGSTEKADFADFEKAVHEIMPAANKRDVEMLWAAYATRSEFETKDDPTAFDREGDGMDEGVQSDANRGFGDKAANAYDNDVLENFLMIAAVASPETGREFQPFLNGLRDSAARALAAANVGEDGRPRDDRAKSLVFLGQILNPRANHENGVVTAADREAVFTMRVNNLMSGVDGISIDSMIRELMAKDETGFAVSRKGAFFLSFLRSLTPPARRRLLQLVSNSASCTKIKFSSKYDAEEKTTVMTLTPSSGRFQSVSDRMVTSSFAPLLRMEKAEIEAKIARLVSEVKGLALNTCNLSQGNLSETVLLNVMKSNFAKLEAALAKVFGHESAMCQALSSGLLFDYMRETTRYGGRTGYAKSELRTIVKAFSPRTKENGNLRGGDTTPEAITCIVDIVRVYLSELEAHKVGDAEEALARCVTTGMEMGLANGEGLLIAHKTASYDTGWMHLFANYTASMPETIARAETLPDRSNKAGSTVAVSSRGVVPVVSRWMDLPVSHEGSFAYIAKNFMFGKTGDALRAMSDEEFEKTVLPRCRQTMAWPNDAHTPILAKNICKDYTANEVYEGCRQAYEKRYVRPDKEVTDPETGAKTTVRGKREMGRWYVPVFSGDHSSGVILQMPVTETGKDGKALVNAKDYRTAANYMCRAIGLKLLGSDTKRSALSSLEAPGMSMRGVKEDASGKRTFGECRVHVFKNFAGDRRGVKGEDEAMLGTMLACGYGVEVQRLCASDPKSQLLKLHYMSTSGLDLTMLKSLTTCVSRDSAKTYGSAIGGSTEQVLSDYLVKFRSADADVSTSVMLDLDAYKVGPGNSKNMGIPVKGKDGNWKYRSLLEYIFEKLEPSAVAGKAVTLDELNALLADGDDGKFSWCFASAAEGAEGSFAKPQRVTVADVLGVKDAKGNPVEGDCGIRVNIVNGLSGPALDFSYVDNNIQSYTVANVSHDARPTVGRTPRNNMIDAITMAAVQKRGGFSGDSALTCDSVMRLIANWGLLASVISTDDAAVSDIRAHASDMVKELLEKGEAQGGMNMEDQVAYEVFKKLAKSLNAPMNKIDAALLSSGAIYDDKTHRVIDHTRSPLLRALHKGSRVFSASDAALYGTSRRLGLAQVNVQDDGFRFGWFLNKAAFAKTYGRGSMPTGEELLEVFEKVVTNIHDADLALAKAMRAEKDYAHLPDADYDQDEYDRLAELTDKAMAKAHKLRDAFVGCFNDHHGRPISGRKSKASHGKYAYSVSFDDLFISAADGTRKFDRSAVYFDNFDLRAEGDLDPSNPVFLAGSTFGLPRTPSYNGSMWLQTVRASLPCTEIKNEDGSFSCGRDAMVMPDPQSLKILGCDHDGDKAQCYMYNVDIETGVAETVDIPSPSDSVTHIDETGAEVEGLPLGKDFAKSGDRKRRYLRELEKAGLVKPPTTARASDARDESLMNFHITRDTRNRISNRFVQGLFDMSRSLKVENGAQETDFYGTVMANATKARPVSEEMWEALKKAADNTRDFMKDKDLGDCLAAAHVATSSQSADKARGMIVDLARLLHLAQFSGKFDLAGGSGALFRFPAKNTEDWINFIYRVDGISNATFDDIKEQICARLGWTSGMMDSVIVDLVTTETAPTTDEEFFECLLKYVTSVRDHGSRYYMMLTSDPSTGDKEIDAVHAAVRNMFAGRADGPVNRDLVMDKFGIEETLVNGKWRYRLRADRTSIGPAMEKVVRELVVASFDASVQKDELVDRVLRQFVADITKRRGVNPGSGFVYYLVKTANKNPGALAEAVRDYVRWSNGERVLQTVRDFTSAFNYTKADPGSGSKLGRREQVAAKFEAVLKDNEANPNKDVDQYLRTMYTANLTAYNATACATRHGRMGLAANNRGAALHALAEAIANRPGLSPALRKLATSIFASEAVPVGNVLQLEGNFQTIPYLLACLQTMPECKGDDVMSGRGGLAAWTTMQAIADGYSDTENFKGTTLHLRQGIEAMFSVMYALVASSKAAVRNPAFAYFSMRRDGGYDQKPFGEAQQTVYRGGKGLRRIVPTFRNKDANSIERARHYIEQVMDGAFDPGGLYGNRVENFGRTDAAKSFVLSEENLAAMEKEAAGNNELMADIALVRRVLKSVASANNRDSVTITPSMMFRQFLPLYSTFTSRTINDEGSTSLIGLFRGKYAELSEKQAEYDRGCLDRGVKADPGMGLIELVASTNLYPVNRKISVLKADKAKKKPGKDFTAEDLDAQTMNDFIGTLAVYSPEDLDGLDLTDIEGLRKIKEKLAGAVPLVRRNPEGRHTVDILGAGSIIRLLHEYANEATGEGNVVEEPQSSEGAEPEPVAAGQDEVPEIRRLADTMRAIVGGWANVNYDGGRSFTITAKTGLKGAGSVLFGKGNETNAVITVNIGGQSKRRGAIDVNSPYVAASFCAAAKALGITSQQFMTLMKDEREALIDCYTEGVSVGGVKDISLSLPSWQLDGKGLMTLAGEINLASAKDAGKLYHEYFHSMIGMFRTMGVFSKTDVNVLRNRFGGPAEGVNELFNEEAAAEEFRKYVNGLVSHDYKVTGIFNNILECLKAIMNALRYGFSHTEAKTDHTLFDMVIGGYASLSRSKLGKYANGSDATAAKLFKENARLREEFVGWLDREGAVEDRAYMERTEAKEGSVTEHAHARLDRAEETYEDPMKDHTMSDAERKLHDLLVAELGGRMSRDGHALPPRKDAVRQIIEALTAIRATGEERKFRFDVGAEAQTPPELLPENIVRAMVSTSISSDPVSEAGRASVYTPMYSIGRAVNRELYNALTDEDRAILSATTDIATDYEKSVAERVLKNRIKTASLKRFKHNSQTARAGLNVFGELTGHKTSDSMYNALLVARKYILDLSRRSSSSAKEGNRWFPKYDPHGHAKRHVSAADYTGFLMASGWQTPKTFVDDLLADLKTAKDASIARSGGENGFTAAIDHIAGNIELVDVDVTRMLDSPAKFNRQFDQFAQYVFSGIDRGEFDDATGTYGDYVPNDGDGEIGRANREVYQLGDGNPDSAELQKLLRRTADTMYAVKASVKFYREIGFQPGSFTNAAFTGRNVPPLSFAELTRNFGIGKSNLVDDTEIIDFNNQSRFLMANLDDWMAGSVRESFGNRPIRQLFLDTAKEFRGHVAVLNNVENWNAAYFGVSRLEGQKLLKLVKRDKSFEMDNGFYHKIDGKGAYLGFDIASGLRGQTTDIEFTEDEYKTVDMYLKSLAVRANGGRRFITGADGFRFTRGANYSIDPSVYDFERVEKLVQQLSSGDNKHRSVPPVIMALYRLGCQWHQEVLNTVDNGYSVTRNSDGSYTVAKARARKTGMSYYRRLVDAMVAGLREAYAEADDMLHSRDKEQMSDAQFNDLVLRKMEAAGVIDCSFSESEKDMNGVHYRVSGVASMGCDEIERMFESSSAYAKLVKAGRDPAVLRGDATIARYMKPYREAMAEIRKHPWLTRGDGRFFNNYDTPLPFYQGTGSFMYHANRIARDSKQTQIVKLGKHELTFQKILNNKGLLSLDVTNATAAQLEMIHDLFGTKEEGDALLQAIDGGDYAKGTAKSMDTGLEINPSDTFMDLCRVIYQKQLELRLRRLEGEAPGKDSDSDDAIIRMIQAYENAVEDAGGTLSGGVGVTDEQMFRMHGALPANMQLGHKIHTALSGIVDAIHYRSALVNMLMTADRNGEPMYYMLPNEYAVEQGGIPDSVWETVAHWWAETNGVAYDIKASGVANARRIFSLVSEARAASKKIKGVRYSELGTDDIDSGSIERVLCREDDDNDTGTSEINKLAGNHPHLFDGGEAIGYARQLFQTSRVLGGGARRQWLNRIMSWSKSLSVAYSFFFPIATKWESAIGAVGAMASLGSNLSPDFARKHAKSFAALQKAFTAFRKPGWIDENFLGFKDVMKMMDSNDPFLGELMMWAESLGITMSNTLNNPMEPTKGFVATDIRNVVDKIRSAMGTKVASRVDAVLNSLLLRGGEKAFTYALNATKLAVTCQIASKLRRYAVEQGKAFDPIRDLGKYADYIDTEIGGINPLRYAWTHPMMRGLMNILLFSWEWTRSAWEAGGGHLFEDMAFGGHSMTKEARQYIVGRWARMFGTVMIGVPMMAQILVKALAMAMGRDDDDDKWWTWENEDKTKWTAFNLTPLMRAIKDHEDAAGIVGTVGGALAGAKMAGLPGAAAGALVGATVMPKYTGNDPANLTTRNRKYYMHFGKQGWEFFRWFSDAPAQFFSKLSMPTQRLLEGVFGRNLSYLDRELPFSNMSAVERWLNLTPDGATANLLKAFVPFTVNGITTFGDAGFLPIAGPVQMGASQTNLVDRMKETLAAWAENDRAGYSFGMARKGKAARETVARSLADIMEDARSNGILNPEELMVRCIGQLAPRYYSRLFNALPVNPGDDYDTKEVSKCVRSLHRLGMKYNGMMDSLKKKLSAQGRDWKSLDEATRSTLKGILKRTTNDPFSQRRFDY